MEEVPQKFKSVVCSACFSDHGLRLDAERLGQEVEGACPNCGVSGFRKLPQAGLEILAHRFFVWGSLQRMKYGGAPLIQFNERQTTSMTFPPALAKDARLIADCLGVGFFRYGPRMWMIGQVEPLEALQAEATRPGVIQRIVTEYPTRTVDPTQSFYRVRVNPASPAEPQEYDSPPDAVARPAGRIDLPGSPALYASPDLEVCLHECRVTAEDEIFVATLAPTRSLRLLNLSVLLKEKDVTEFESLDMSVHMLFLAGEHSYEITRAIAQAARGAGFDGLIYPSYFSLLRLGVMPFQTVYGISLRRFPSQQAYEESKTIPNLALFGRPVADGHVSVQCINRVLVSRVVYDCHFGPTGV